MDNFLLQTIVNELELMLRGHRFGKIYQLGATDLAVDLYLRKMGWLVISTDPRRLAFYLTARNPKELGDEPRNDTAFVALGKKYLGAARLATIERVGWAGGIFFDFDAKDEDGKPVGGRLVVPPPGRGANVRLIKDPRVMARLRERDETITDSLDPALPADKLDPFLCSPE